MVKSSFDYCILGAGLAGISLADSLIQKNATVCVMDTGEIASGASGTPLGLVNPATGRYGTKSWMAEACYDAIFSSLQKTQSETLNPFFKKSGVLRPALDEKIASRMKENMESTSWPENWCQWLDEKEVRAINADINCVDGGLWLPIGLTVDIAAYLKAKAELLEEHGVKFITKKKYKFESQRNGFNFSFGNGDQIHSKNVIYTAGFDTIESSFWKNLELIPVKGQVAVFKAPSPLTFDYAISALGYIASLSKDQFIIGSTYEHNFEHRNPDEQGLDYLVKRMSKVYPSLVKSSSIVKQWAGIRASTPNRKPILGKHPEVESLYVFAGLGSKGLLYSAYLAELMAGYMVGSNKLPAEVSINRL